MTHQEHSQTIAEVEETQDALRKSIAHSAELTEQTRQLLARSRRSGRARA